VGIVLIAWLVLAGLPFGGDRDEKTEPVQTETIGEGTATTREPGTVLEVPGDGKGTIDDTSTIATTTTMAPPAAVGVNAPPISATTPPITAASEPPARPATKQPIPTTQPARTPPIGQASPGSVPAPAPSPAAPAPTAGRRISEAEAAAELRGYITGRNYYGVASECVKINGKGFRNEGYGFDVWHACAGGGSSRLLGRWRVDAKTREVFRQQDDGRYLRP
jgi:hypothetical protein